LQRLPLDFFSGRRRGDLVARLTGDVSEIEELLVAGIGDALSYGLRIVFFMAVLFYLSWQLALVALLVAPFFWLASQWFASRIKQVARDQRRRSGAISAVAEEALATMPLVQVYNREDMAVDRFHRESLGNFVAQMRLTRMRAFFTPLLDLFELGGVLVVVGYGTWQLGQGVLTLGGLLVFLAYLTQLLEPVRNLSQFVTSISAAAAGAERVVELLDQTPAIETNPQAVTLSARGVVTFDEVSFSYPDSQRSAVNDVSFHLEPGQMLALVGDSGAGKSTIVRLLLRFYDPVAGTISVDGHDLRQLNLRSLRDSIAVVLQESLLLGGTIRDNIAFGRLGATDEEIERAARAADAHDFIVRLPQGYDTPVGQGGARLSGGQRQRIAIARAMIKDAPILILDEPTTGLDAAAAARVMVPLRRLMKDRTTIVVAHNLLTVRDATTIVVLDKGRVVQQGTHDELVGVDGPYDHLYRLHHPDVRVPRTVRELEPVA
jgi:ATP-binding cassette, subfamily B, bacterial